ILCRTLLAARAEVTIAATASLWPDSLVEDLRAAGARILLTPFGFGRWARLGKLQAMATWPLMLREPFDTLYCHGTGRMHLWVRRFVRPGGFSVYHEIIEAPTPGS